MLSSSPISPEQLVAVLQTDGDGRYRYTAAGSTNRTLRFAYAGSALVLPAADARSRCSVPALTSLRVSRRRVLNGQAVTFSGQGAHAARARRAASSWSCRSASRGRWQTFRTTRTDAAGRWAIQYRFKRTRGVQRYPLPRAAAARGQLPVRRRRLALADRPRQGPMMRALSQRRSSWPRSRAADGRAAKLLAPQGSVEANLTRRRPRASTSSANASPTPT